jgi:hypothetical protein
MKTYSSYTPNCLLLLVFSGYLALLVNGWEMSVLFAGADGPEEHAAHPGEAGPRGTDQEHHGPAGAGQKVQGGICQNFACKL